MAVKNSVKAIELQDIDAATLTALYQPINPAGLTEACFLLRIINASNVRVFISYDGVTNNDVLAPNTSIDVQAQANAQPQNYVAKFAQGLIISASAVAPGVGAIYVTGYFQPI